jgi:hypothetical protein
VPDAARDYNILKYSGKYYLVHNGKAYPIVNSSLDAGAFAALGGMTPTKYKTGGLADYTGPAWLDGTPTKPELVLNQNETEDFLKAVDILRSLNLSMLQSVAAMSVEGMMSRHGAAMGADRKIEQTVHITAEFPNATNRTEIEEAFKNLSNLAT